MIFTAEPYQLLLRNHLLAHDRAWANVGLGLGKTATTLDALNEKFINGSIRAVLVVAPLRVATMTWPNEIKKWSKFRWMKVEVLRGQKPSGRAQIYCINYEQLLSLANLNFVDGVVIDETTKAKNPKSKRINAFRPLLKNHFRWGLTGTPRPNSLLELFAQVRLIDDGARLGKSFSQFQKSWFTPDDYMEYSWSPKAGAEEAIYQRIHDITLTLRASDYLNLPDTIVEDIDVALPDEAQKVYKMLERELLVVMGREGDVVAQNAANLAGKLHQITGGNVYNENREPVFIHDAKIKALKKTLARLGGERALIGCNYIHERTQICAAIPGAVDASTIKGDVETLWNSGKIQYLVANPGSLGHGLNLQEGGRTIVWYSLPWSRELLDQFQARVARKGQTLQPMIYRLLCPGTIDDAVAETLRQRGEGQSEMMQILTNFRQQGLSFKLAA